MAYSVDPLGNHSPTNSVEVFYTTYGTLALLTNGYGTNKPGFTNKPAAALNGFVYNNLVVGANYSVKAVPNPNYLFSNWIETYSSNTLIVTNMTNANPWTFLMESNMTLTAYFVTNLFTRVAGPFNGLFYDTNGVSTRSSGLLGGLTVDPQGSYSGTLYIGGTTKTVSGKFDLAGHASNQIANVARWGTLSLVMNLDWNQSSPQITGTVAGTNGGAWTAELTNELAGTNLDSAEYTMLIPPGTDTNSPDGYGYALMTNHLGSVTVTTGKLADGTAFAPSIAESKNLRLPFYATPYTNGGLLLGWLDLSSGAPEGTLTLIRPAAASGLFTNGYTNIVAVQSSAWTNLGTNTGAISLPLGGTLTVSNGFLAEPLTFYVHLSTSNTFSKLANSATNSLTGSIAAKTGLLSITFGNGNGTKTTTGTGAILQGQNTGAGYFATPTNAGVIQLIPTP
jgi:hypothetical protein